MRTKTTLVDKQVEEGKTLLKKLDEKNFNIKAAFWIFDQSWKFALASSSHELDVNKNPLNAYKALAEVLQTISNLSMLSISDIVLMSLNDPLIKNISSVIKTDSGISDMIFANSMLNNTYIEGMHLFRMNLD